MLADMIRMMKEAPVQVDRKIQQTLLDMWKRFMRVTEQLDIYIPKSHLMYHLIIRLYLMGNPMSYTTFLDESLNKTLKKVCRLCHQMTFDTMCVIKMHQVLQRTGRARLR